MLRLLSDDAEDRVTKVLEALDLDTLKDLNDEQIEHIKELIRKQPHIFGLPGEQLKATHLVMHKIMTTTDEAEVSPPARYKGTDAAANIKMFRGRSDPLTALTHR